MKSKADDLLDNVEPLARIFKAGPLRQWPVEDIIKDKLMRLSANGDVAMATPKLASLLTDDFTIAVTISADYLGRLAAMRGRLLQEFGIEADEFLNREAP